MNAIKNNIGKICMIYGLLASAMVLFLWAYGYWMNGKYGMKFPVDSCSTLLASGFGTGLIGFFKWAIDSWKNSPQGIYPDAKKVTVDTKGDNTNVR